MRRSTRFQMLLASSVAFSCSQHSTTGQEQAATLSSASADDSATRKSSDGSPSDGKSDGTTKNSEFVVALTASCFRGTDCREVAIAVKLARRNSQLDALDAKIMSEYKIAKTSWDFSKLPKGVSCNPLGGDVSYAASCRGGVALGNTLFSLTFSLETTEGHRGSGSIEDTPPADNPYVVGNFMKIAPVANLTPSGATYRDSDNAFTEIWQELTSKIYMTNLLGSGLKGTADWRNADTVCSQVDSGDGSVWRLPTLAELCGSDITGDQCKGGFFAAGIGPMKIANYQWSRSLWTSSTKPPYHLKLYAVNFLTGAISSHDNSEISLGFFCVRSR